VVSGLLLVSVWLLVDPRTPDLAAQTYRVNLFSHSGMLLFDTRWYGGHDMPGYSLLFPLLGSTIGIRTAGALAAICSCVLFERVAVRVYGPSGRVGAVLFAVAAVGDVWSGRLTFAAGVTFAMASVLALLEDHRVLAAALALLCTAFSPVAGLLLALALFTHALAGRCARNTVVVVPVLALLLTTTLLFGEGGYEPYPLLSFVATIAVTLGFLLTLGPGQRLLRLGGLLYLAACLASLLIHTPMGSNIERYGVLLFAALLLSIPTADSVRLRSLRALALAGALTWTVWGPVRETLAVAHNPSTSASYYVPVRRFLARVAASSGSPVRVEVPLTRSHWEAALLAPYVSLARGWEKQLDERYDAPLLSGSLTAQRYRRWLDEQAVSYVALPDAPLDHSSAGEGQLIRDGLPYLRRVFASRHWRIYEVLNPTPLLSGPGRLTSLGHDSFGLQAPGAGSLLVRVHYTPYWALATGAGCVGRGTDGWTAVTASHAGAITVTARFSLARALGSDPKSCRR
jgi:hypothetical protein